MLNLKKNNMKKIIGKIINVISSLWETILFICIIALLLLRFAPIPFGYMPVVCESNSMAPTFYKNSLCYVDKNYDVDSIREGDILAFQLSNGELVTHRAYEITDEGIVTKGDANEDVDISPITKEQIIGENVLQLEYIGALFQGKNGIPSMLLIYSAVFAIALKFLLDIIANSLLEESNNQKNNEKREETNTVNENENS